MNLRASGGVYGEQNTIVGSLRRAYAMQANLSLTEVDIEVVFEGRRGRGRGVRRVVGVAARTSAAARGDCARARALGRLARARTH